MDPHPVHWIYRLTFTIIEPFMAFMGVCQIHFDPASYLAIANPNVVYVSTMQPLLTSILGGWLVILFNDLVTLRVFSWNVKLWRLVLSAHLLSDVAYSYAVYQDMGTARFLSPWVWSKVDWLTLGTTIPPMVLKIAFLLGVGVDVSGEAYENASAKGRKVR